MWFMVCKFSLAVITLQLVVGCKSADVRKEISDYKQVAYQVELGDSKQQVLSILMPTQKKVEHKQTDKYFNNGETVEIYYFRSASYSDGILTDDEFTPYQFVDGVLVGIGWKAIGGAQTHYDPVAKAINDAESHRRSERNIKNGLELMNGTRTLADPW